MRIFRGPTGHNAFTGLSIGFIAAVAAAFIFGDHDPNSGTAILAGVVTAFVVTPLVTFLSFLVHRAIKGPRG
jgi:cation transporter-like permease